MAKSKQKKRCLTKHTNPKSSAPLLTSQNDGIFRVAFAGEAEKNYNFCDCTKEEWHKLGVFLDSHTGKKISEVNKYKRQPDRSDYTNDPFDNRAKNIDHYALSSKYRIHGYYNSMGYFTITRIDPSHTVHPRK